MNVLFIAIGIIIAAALFAALRVFFGLGHPGNAAPYALRRQPRRENSPLRGKTILCLGSSISSGFSSGGVSFLDYLGRIDGCRIIQETVSARHWPTAGIIPTSSGCAAAWPAWGSPRIILSASFPPMTPPSAACRAKSAAAAARRTLMFPPPWEG